MLPQVVLAVEPFAAFIANVSLLPGMDDKVQRQLLLPLERLQADRADERPLRIVALLVAGQVILALQRCVANVADESPLQVVSD